MMDKLHDEAGDESVETGDTPAAPDAELEALRKAVEEAEQKALYAAAEVQNVRRRSDQERAQAVTYANTGFARDMLSVKDNLDRALSHVPEGAREDERLKGFIEGIEATARELDAVFGRHGIARVEAKGLPLDPNRHQAMIEIVSAEPPGTIIEEMQAGYVLKDRLLRPALVGVAKAG